jgi:large subunit ribosomal protein L30
MTVKETKPAKAVKADKPAKAGKSGPITVTSKTAATGGKLKVTMTKGWAGKRRDQQKILRGLGLRRRMQSNILADTRNVLGMIAKVAHLVTVEKV